MSDDTTMALILLGLVAFLVGGVVFESVVIDRLYLYLKRKKEERRAEELTQYIRDNYK